MIPSTEGKGELLSAYTKGKKHICLLAKIAVKNDYVFDKVTFGGSIHLLVHSLMGKALFADNARDQWHYGKSRMGPHSSEKSENHRQEQKGLLSEEASWHCGETSPGDESELHWGQEALPLGKTEEVSIPKEKQ